MSKKNPVAFKDLSEDELRAAAGYFGTDLEGPMAVILADLTESGVEWEAYADVFLKEAETPVATTPGVVKSSDLDLVREVEEVTEEVVTKPPVEILAQANYLIKMERENPYFEFGQYKFTAENPYAIMPAEDAQVILSTEVGFRQAFPAELQDYYS